MYICIQAKQQKVRMNKGVCVRTWARHVWWSHVERRDWCSHAERCLTAEGSWGPSGAPGYHVLPCAHQHTGLLILSLTFTFNTNSTAAPGMLDPSSGALLTNTQMCMLATHTQQPVSITELYPGWSQGRTVPHREETLPWLYLRIEQSYIGKRLYPGWISG